LTLKSPKYKLLNSEKHLVILPKLKAFLRLVSYYFRTWQLHLTVWLKFRRDLFQPNFKLLESQSLLLFGKNWRCFLTAKTSQFSKIPL